MGQNFLDILYLHAGLDQVGDIGDDDVWRRLESGLCVGGVPLFVGGGRVGIAGLRLVHESEWWRPQALGVLG